MRTLDQWTDLVRGSVRNVTNDEAKAIGQMCFDAYARRETHNVWHMTSLYFSQTCPCRVCNG